MYFIEEKININKLMKWFILTLIPGMIVQIYLFGFGLLYQLFLSIITALISEALVMYLRNNDIIFELKNNSALVTGVILAVCIPPLSPWWLITIGTAFAIIVVKHLYGGLGKNIFNPAMMSYVVLLISFPIHMTYWLPIVNFDYFSMIKYDLSINLKIIFYDDIIKYDVLKQAKLLHENYYNLIKTNIFETRKLITFIVNILKRSEIYCFLISNQWKVLNITYFICGIVMLYNKIIKWHIPISCLITLFSCSLLSWLLSPTEYYSPMIHLFLGGTMFGIFFVATDPVTSSMTKYGNIVYGIIIGFFIWIIRIYCGYYDAIAFAVLLGNILVPCIDYYIEHKINFINKK